MSGRHEGPPLGSAAREATAAPYHGRHRALEVAGWLMTHPPGMEPPRWLLDEPDEFDGPDDPPRCGSCGHQEADDCGCTCCIWDEHQERPADV